MYILWPTLNISSNLFTVYFGQDDYNVLDSDYLDKIKWICGETLHIFMFVYSKFVIGRHMFVL